MIRLQEHIFALGFFSLYVKEQLIKTYCFGPIGLVFVARRGKFSEHPELECRKSRTYQLPRLDEKMVVWCAMSVRRESSTVSGQELQR